MMSSKIEHLVFFYRSIAVNVSLLGVGWLLCVSLPVKVGKEEEEHGSVEKDDIAEDFGEVTWDEEWQRGVDKEGHELTQLHCS